MSQKDRESDGAEASEESGIETADESCEIQVDSQNSEDSSEISQPEIEVDVTDVVAVKETPADKSGRESKSSNSEAANIVYQFPDDSEFCESAESFSNLRKRPSNSTIESTSKKTCKEVKMDTGSQVSTTIEDKSSETMSSGTADKANNNNPNYRSPFLFGCKHKREGESKKSGNATSRTLDSSGRFTKHKGDSKCHHGNFDDCVPTCSSDDADADVEDNAEDASMESRKIPPKNTQSLSSPNQLQNAIKGIVRRNIKPAPGNNNKPKDSSTKLAKRPHQEVTNKKKESSSKTVPRPGAISKSAVTKDKQSANSDKTSSASKYVTSSAESNPEKAKSQSTRQKKRRCRVCNKKLDLTATHCRCGGLFCAKHRYDKEHDCTFDYRAMGREEIRKNNPKIIAEKVKKI